jgi:hypothetical protein
LAPAPDGWDDFVGIGEPLKGLRVGVVIIKEAVDSGLEVGDGSEDAALETTLGQDGEKPSTALSQEAEVGVKWKVQRGWRASHFRAAGCLWAAEVSMIAWIVLQREPRARRR